MRSGLCIGRVGCLSQLSAELQTYSSCFFSANKDSKKKAVSIKIIFEEDISASSKSPSVFSSGQKS